MVKRIKIKQTIKKTGYNSARITTVVSNGNRTTTRTMNVRVH